MISETVSEKKQRRGRPLSYLPKLQEMVLRDQPGITKRCAQDTMNCYDAMALLDGKEEFAYICSVGSLKKTILAALGRIKGNDDAILDLARHICKTRMKARAAVAMVKRYRKGKGYGDPVSLANVLVARFNEYVDSHPQMSMESAIKAVEMFSASVNIGIEGR
jgi:hypothetical protein